ncbi:hypothetical protein [uncultured Massilia sp.]|uniref:hypothetical protein n=1 Tax=uncultured Massilia sp. TaxID=169973 RepID=UPI0025EED099|nr:hypothetical protein [uncultured Massilia sp.]
MTATAGAKQRLQAGRAAARAGRHEEALREFAWFHDHALDDTPSLYGVRLSFALHDWVRLGEAYPPARQALDAVRARKAQALLDGAADFSLFHDVASIDEMLGMPQATGTLYAALAERAPAFARAVAGVALPLLVQAGDYVLADRMRPEPAQALREHANLLARHLRWARRQPYAPMPLRWSFIEGHAALVRMHVAITAAVGGPAAAGRLAAQAIAAIPDPLLRATVREQIARPSGARVYRKRRRGWSPPRRVEC